jgi:hypothetical protein
VSLLAVGVRSGPRRRTDIRRDYPLRRRCAGLHSGTEGALAIYRHLKLHSFSPAEVDVLTSVYESVCADLELVPRQDGLNEIVALTIIEIVRNGQRDPDGIRRDALNALGH